MNLDELKEELHAASTQRDKLQVIISLGDDLTPARREEFTPEDKVPGCASDAYMQVKLMNGKARFKAWSASLIIKGYLAIITELFAGKTKEEILSEKETLETFAKETGIATLNAAPTRTNSFMRIYEFIEKSL